MSESSVTETGSFRLQVRMPRGWVRVGNFLTLRGAGNLARDLAIDSKDTGLSAVKVEYADRRGWHTAWSWSTGTAARPTLSLLDGGAR